MRDPPFKTRCDDTSLSFNLGIKHAGANDANSDLTDGAAGASDSTETV